MCISWVPELRSDLAYLSNLSMISPRNDVILLLKYRCGYWCDSDLYWTSDTFSCLWSAVVVGIEHCRMILVSTQPLIARFMGPTWGPSGTDRTQVGHIFAPWTLLSGALTVTNYSIKSVYWILCVFQYLFMIQGHQGLQFLKLLLLVWFMSIM